MPYGYHYGYHGARSEVIAMGNRLFTAREIRALQPRGVEYRLTEKAPVARDG
jgi:hypothetical protein